LRALLAVGTLLWLAALFLPWEHWVIVAQFPHYQRDVEDLRVTTVLPMTVAPFVSQVYSASRIQTFAEMLCLSVSPVLGVALLLLFFSAPD
jgi:hypothetical protein